MPRNTTIALIWMSLASPALAENEVSFDAEVGAVSTYMFRDVIIGEQNRPALQNSFTADSGFGLYGNLWTSNFIERSKELTAYDELDIVAGYAFEAGSVGFDVGFVEYINYNDSFAIGEAYVGVTSPEFAGLSASLVSAAWFSEGDLGTAHDVALGGGTSLADSHTLDGSVAMRTATAANSPIEMTGVGGTVGYTYEPSSWRISPSFSVDYRTGPQDVIAIGALSTGVAF